MAEWYEDLEDLWGEIWRRLERGVADRRAPARHPVLATAGLEGGAEARVVVLRAASAEDAMLEVHTDSASSKVGELARDPRATLLIWEDRARLQIRMKARVEILKGAGAARAWARIPEGAQQVYGGAPAPGTPIPAPEAHEPGPDPERFTVLTARIGEVDALHLGRDRHRRARFRAADNWRGEWLAP